MSEQLLDGADIVAIFEQVGGETVAEGVAGDGFVESGGFSGLFDGALQGAGVDVVAAQVTGLGIFRDARSGKGVLPGPGFGGVRVFDSQCEGKVDLTEPVVEIHAEGVLDAGEVGDQWGGQGCGEDGIAVFGALAVAHEDLVLFKIDIFHAQVHAFHETKSTAVEQLSHELVDSFKTFEHGARFGFGQYGGQALRAAGAQGLDGLGDLLPENGMEEEENGTEGLVLGGSGDLAIDGEVIEVGFDFGFSHAARVLEIVEAQEAPDPAQVSFLGSVGIVFTQERTAYFFDQRRWRAVHVDPPGCLNERGYQCILCEGASITSSTRSYHAVSLFFKPQKGGYHAYSHGIIQEGARGEQV
jgi:hypothetical protein